MLMNIINYLVRIIIIIIGIVLLSGLFVPPNSDPTMIKMLGGLFVLWGIFRLVTYRTKMKQYQRRDEE